MQKSNFIMHFVFKFKHIITFGKPKFKQKCCLFFTISFRNYENEDKYVSVMIVFWLHNKVWLFYYLSLTIPRKGRIVWILVTNGDALR